MVSLYHDATHTTAGGDPHIMVFVFCNTTHIVIAKTLFLCQIVQTVILQVQDVQSFTCTYPNQTSGVLNHLSDIVVGKRLDVRCVTCQYLLLRRREVQYHQSLSCTDIEVIALSFLIIEKACDVVRVQFSILTGIGGEGVHLGIIHLQTTIGRNPHVADLIRAEGIDMVVYQSRHTVLG